jgi:hypothetical protein
MAEILGLTVSHHPYMRFKPHMMPNVLIGNMERGWADKPHLKEPQNWPAAMKIEWADDRGLAVGTAAQKKQIAIFQKLNAALTAFAPDFIVCIHRDQLTGDNQEKPQYWILATEQVDVQFYQLNGQRDNYFGVDPDTVTTLPGHREAALYLADALRAAGLKPRVFDEVPIKAGLGSHALAGIFAMDWDKQEFKTPVISLGIDPWRFGRARNNEGLSTWDPNAADPPLTPKEGFDLGRKIAEAFKASPWRVALVASTAWTGANGFAKDRERINPNIPADKKVYAEWAVNKFDTWGQWFTWEEFEEQGQWELLISTVLAGAMTEIGARVKWSDFQANEILNSTWVSTEFEVK